MNEFKRIETYKQIAYVWWDDDDDLKYASPIASFSQRVGKDEGYIFLRIHHIWKDEDDYYLGYENIDETTIPHGIIFSEALEVLKTLPPISH